MILLHTLACMDVSCDAHAEADSLHPAMSAG